MSNLIINLDLGLQQAPKRGTDSNQKHQRFVKRRRFLERRGFLKQKQLPPPQHHPPKGQVSHQDSCSWGRTKKKWLAEDQNSFQTDGLSHQLKTFPKANNHCCFDQPSATRDSGSALPCFPSGTRKVTCRSAKVSGTPGNHSAQPLAGVQKASLLSEYDSGLPLVPRPGKPSKVVAIDCEMVGTGPGGRISDLARCSIVSYHGDVVYDKYVRPVDPITDYRTRWSGIRKHHMKNATPFKTAQKEILKLLAGKIVVGHAIHNDFKALKYFHPKSVTRDTSKIPLLNRKAGFPENESASLKRLTKQLLHKDIQVGKNGHSSVEDAKATMELYRVIEAEWERQLALNPEQE
ncbi:interferon-stimulated 20 kDa exonuclease-like 2 [Chelonoidis abingdonii]|uniref:Interferon stimulated exonuclease 20 like 2 n=1 Tax=Chelonoidis abingdonii TaxID=106734 RepID=A0A8C0IY88_CHEAB|nr:interferon-stimulated 20 kDa exonuclease-like 2 isoform X1 [Chelonoidis abingdonii]